LTLKVHICLNIKVETNQKGRQTKGREKGRVRKSRPAIGFNFKFQLHVMSQCFPVNTEISLFCLLHGQWLFMI